MFERLLPVLPVTDVDAEVAFYAALGFTAERTHTGFTALQRDSVLFGVQGSGRRVPPEDLAWQMWVKDVGLVYDLAIQRGLDVVSAPRAHPAGFWIVQLRTPNGYLLTLEGPEPTSGGGGTRSAAASA
ncbi:hypothetical protein [Nonomuraea typhae]|uniref:VOC domain-containing protein n=1 Tax=Nonomuraea typhae TaxID=2603600 RepID=A0ABW7ZAW3_9ACTN